MFITVLFVIAKPGNNLDVLQQVNGETNCSTSIHGILFNIKNEQILIAATTWMNLQEIILSGKRNHDNRLHTV